MPATVIDLSALIAAVAEAETIDTSAIAFIAGVGARIQAAVDAAIAADDAADEGTAQAVREAISAEVAKLTASSGKLSEAIIANTPSA